MKKGIFLALAILMISCFACGCSLGTAPDNTEKINNSDVYEFVDKETGVHYFIYSHGSGYRGMGGITPRLNTDGSVMVDEVEENEK